MPLDFSGRHVRRRMQQRGVLQEQVERCVALGTAADTEHGRRTYVLGDLKVVVQRRTQKVVTVLTTAVHVLPDVTRLSVAHHRRLSHDLGVHAWWDEGAGQYELHGRPDHVERAVHYIRLAGAMMVPSPLHGS